MIRAVKFISLSVYTITRSVNWQTGWSELCIYTELRIYNQLMIKHELVINMLIVFIKGRTFFTIKIINKHITYTYTYTYHIHIHIHITYIYTYISHTRLTGCLHKNSRLSKGSSNWRRSVLSYYKYVNCLSRPKTFLQLK